MLTTSSSSPPLRTCNPEPMHGSGRHHQLRGRHQSTVLHLCSLKYPLVHSSGPRQRYVVFSCHPTAGITPPCGRTQRLSRRGGPSSQRDRDLCMTSHCYVFSWCWAAGIRPTYRVHLKTLLGSVSPPYRTWLRRRFPRFALPAFPQHRKAKTSLRNDSVSARPWYTHLLCVLCRRVRDDTLPVSRHSPSGLLEFSDCGPTNASFSLWKLISSSCTTSFCISGDWASCSPRLLTLLPYHH